MKKGSMHSSFRRRRRSVTAAICCDAVVPRLAASGRAMLAVWRWLRAKSLMVTTTPFGTPRLLTTLLAHHAPQLTIAHQICSCRGNFRESAPKGTPARFQVAFHGTFHRDIAARGSLTRYRGRGETRTRGSHATRGTAIAK
eukprot:647145-Pleurochrysis_carterae.AAC.4